MVIYGHASLLSGASSISHLSPLELSRLPTPSMSNANSESGLIETSQPSEGIDNAIPPLPEKWDRCHAYNERKRRYCRQMPIPLSRQDRDSDQPPRYCGNHRHLLDEWLSKNHGDCMPVKRPRITNTQTASETKDEPQSKKDRGKRVPCPIDPSHFIFEGAISKHVLVCPAVKQKQDAAKREYYSEGINLGGYGDMGSTVSGSDMLDLEDAKKFAYAVLRAFHFLFLSSDGSHGGKKSNHGTLSEQQLQNITAQEIYDAIPEVDLSHVEEGHLQTAPNPLNGDVHSNAINDAESSGEANQNENTKAEHNIRTNVGLGRLTDAITKHRIKAGGPRHLHQIASILGHVRQKGLISTNKSEPENNPMIVEMGAGRGMTGLIVAGSMAASLGQTNSSGKVKLYLVERCGTRAKAETKVRTADGKHSKDDCLRLDLVEVTRVKCDLAHVDMSAALPRSKSSKTVVIAKHLCGAGTDLALKSLRSIGAIDGCVMASCCHGLCTWNEFVGRDCLLHLFSSEIGGLTTFGENAFNLLKRWTSASVLEDRPTSEDDSVKVDGNEIIEDHYGGTAEEETGRYPNIFTVVKELELGCGGNGLGRACQRLIDHGRCEYLRKTILASDSSSDDGAFNVSLLHYCNKSITPQNALIVASRN